MDKNSNWLHPAMVREARATGRGHLWIVELLIFLLVLLVGSILQGIPLIGVTLGWIFGDQAFLSEAMAALQAGDAGAYTAMIMGRASQPPAWMSIVNLFSTGIMTLTAILFCRWIEKRKAATMGFRRRAWLREYGIGVLVGFAMISLAAALGYLTGAYRFAFSEFSPLLILGYLLGFIVQGMSEEAVCRGYLMISISRKNPVWLAVVLSSLVFALLHLGNNGVGLLALVNILLCGASFAVYMLKRGDIWGVSAIHSLWNFFQGHLYGISVSGTGGGGNTSILTALTTGKPIWTGGDFGIEGGLCVTIVELAALLLFIFVLPARKEDAAAEPVLPQTPELPEQM